MSKYVGGAVVVFDLRLRRVKWQQHLDLSTDSTPYRAYIYSAPVLVDLDRDGKLEVVVGTSAVRRDARLSLAPFIVGCQCTPQGLEAWCMPCMESISPKGETHIAQTRPATLQWLLPEHHC